MKGNRRLLLSALASVAIAAPALAADYDPPIYIEEAPEWVPVEIGSGWYLRGDIAYTFDRKFRDRAIEVNDALLRNDFVSFGPLDVFGFSERTSPISGSIGFGYHINDFLRAEVNIGRLFADRYTGTGFLNAGTINFNGNAIDVGCLGTRTTTVAVTDEGGAPVGVPAVATDANARGGCDVDAELRNTAWTGMANGYVDLGTVAGFTPYIGGGVGMLYSRTRLNVTAECEANQTQQTTPLAGLPPTQTQTTNVFLCRGQNAPDAAPVTYDAASYRNASYNFIYGLNAGVAYQLTENAKLDLGYQYVSAPKLNHYTLNEDGLQRRSGFNFHQVKLGLRYELW